MNKKKYPTNIHVFIPPDVEQAYRRSFYGLVPKASDFLRQVIQEVLRERQWHGLGIPEEPNRWKFFVKLGVSEDVFRAYKSMTKGERLEFQRRVAEVIRQKLKEAVR